MCAGKWPVDIGAEERSSVAGNENKAALAYVVRAEEAAGMVQRLVAYREIEQLSKYIQDNGSQASLCWRKELQTWKGRRLE